MMENPYYKNENIERKKQFLRVKNSLLELELELKDRKARIKIEIEQLFFNRLLWL